MNERSENRSARKRTDRDHRERMGRVLSYIAERLGTRLDLAEVAKVACFSPHHFHRVFAAYVGEPLSEYVRRERLLASAARLAETGEAIAEIALASGYDTPAAFARAFKRYFGITPSAYRMLGERRMLHHPERPLNKPYIRRMAMQPEMRELEDLTVLCVTRRGVVDGNFTRAADEAFDALLAWLRERDLLSHTRMCLGICPDDPDIVPAAEARYIAGVVLDCDARTDGEVTIETIPGGRWAVFTHKGPYNTLGETWGAAYRDWLPSSNAQLRDTAPFEVYLNNKWTTQPEDLLTEIYIPVR
ncbi:MAG TPA: AraC family transcriptional regulator [Candidatus Kapabacteria bacterium]|nr:AraC family transcriptional regulator [Candidatus Kapabacteria bacterium]